MASYTRRLQRSVTRRKPSGLVAFGTRLGVHNVSAKDFKARTQREEKRVDQE